MSDIIKNPYFQPDQASPDKPTQVEGSPYDVPDCPPFIRTSQSGDRIFFVEKGNVHWIKNPETLTALGGNFDKVVTIEMSLFRKLKANVESINMENVDRYIKVEQPIIEAEIVESPPQAEEPPKVESMPLQTFELDSPIGFNREALATVPREEPEKGFTSIIIPAYFVHYPSFHFTGNCIGSIREHTDKEKTPYEIILIINGKTDIKFDNLEQTMADKVITNEENKGFAYAVNQGIRMARGEYIGILNNDSMVYNYWLEDMQEALQHLDMVMATPMYGKPYARSVESQKLRETTMDKPIQESFSDFRDFSCVLTRKSLFTELGTFDEQFFMYGEDLDFFRRMDKANKKYATTRRVNIHHIIQGTATGVSESDMWMTESKEKLKEKWGY